MTDLFTYRTWAFPLRPLGGSANRLRQSGSDPKRKFDQLLRMTGVQRMQSVIAAPRSP